MIVQRIIAGAIALGAMVAAAGVVVVALAFAVYSVLRDHVGPAAAAAIIAAAFAVLLAIAAFVMFGRAKHPKPKPKAHHAKVEPSSNMADRLMGALGERPIVAAGAAVAAGLLAWRNPQFVATLLRAYETRPARERP